MLWWSDALSNEERPAVIALAATFTAPTVIEAEAVYYDTPLPPGPLPGWFMRSRSSTPERITLDWPPPDALPCDGLRTLHPADGWTPATIVTTDAEGIERVRLEALP